MRRIRRRNLDLVSEARPARATPEQYALFRRYVGARHSDGGMADMSMVDYQMMIEDSHVDTRLVEYRLGPEPSGDAGALIACCLTDRLSDGLSMVYSFYEPDLEHRSLGAFMILDHAERAKGFGLPHVYLGYWVEGSRKDGLQVALPAAGAAGHGGLDAGRLKPRLLAIASYDRLIVTSPLSAPPDDWISAAPAARR